MTVIALRQFSLGIYDRFKWQIPNQSNPRDVPKAAIFSPGDTAEERDAIAFLFSCNAVGNASDSELVARIQGEVQAASNPHVKKTREIELAMLAEHLNDSTNAQAELKKTSAKLETAKGQLEYTSASLRTTADALAKAEKAAGHNLKEALAKWMRFDPPGMRTQRKANIAKAVQMYLTEDDKRSLTKIAHEFGKTPKAVSVWFKTFTAETGFPVVTHRRHESVAARLKAQQHERIAKEGNMTPFEDDNEEK